MGIKYLWLGSYQSDEQFQSMPVRNIGQASGFASQKGLIKGLDYLLTDEDVLDTIGVVSYPVYPTYPELKVKREKWTRTGISKDVTIGYINIKYITYLSRGISFMNEVKKWAEDVPEDDVIVIIYEPSVTKLKAAYYLKKKVGAKVFVVIPDIPEFVNLGANRIIKFAKRVQSKRIRALFFNVDGFILYSACMADYYGLKRGQWMLMEGVFDAEEALSEYDVDDHSSIRLMYCGALDEYRGIPQLLKAFSKLDDREYELWLTGAGKSDELINEYAMKDPRIHHYGYLDKREDVLALQRCADILIHTRDITSPAAPYCFPSKVLEYLATGKPVISVKIPGIPDEYFKYMIPITNLSADEIEKAIRSATNLSDEEKNKLRTEEKEFIMKNKTSEIQAGKIISFMKNIAEQSI